MQTSTFGEGRRGMRDKSNGGRSAVAGGRMWWSG